MTDNKNINRGGLWASQGGQNYYGRLDINGTEYLAKLWKLEGGKGLLVLSGEGPRCGEQTILYPSDASSKTILRGTVGTKENKEGWVNVFKSDSSNEKAPVLNLTFKPMIGENQSNATVSTDF
jgi:hypothetical protein